jgi:hypothetical protein
VTKTELEWLKQFDLGLGRLLRIKSDWFEDVTPAPIEVKIDMADAFKAEIQSIAESRCGFGVCQKFSQEIQKSGPEGMTVSDENPPSDSWDQSDQKR